VDVKIKRHVKIRGWANPCDPEWEMYFEGRPDKQTAENLKYRKRMFSLWKKQNGLCPVCRQRINEQTGWHKHRTIWKVDGGRDTPDNPVLLHPNCHRQLHSLKLKVKKPDSERGL
jgi:RNA-directed DNA polymerase